MQDNSLSVEHFPDICRFCLVYASPENVQFPLFLHQGQYGRYVKNCKESLPEIISSCLGINVSIQVEALSLSYSVYIYIYIYIYL